MYRLEGAPGAPGIARGLVWIYRPPDLAQQDQAGSVSQETDRVNQALRDADKELRALAELSNGVEAEILEAQRLFLNDPMLLDQTRERILQGAGAVTAWRDSVRSIVEQFQTIGQEPWRSRADEVRDVGERVLRSLLKVSNGDVVARAKDRIVVAQTLVASQVLDMARQGALGFALSECSPASHVAIMAKALQVPTVLGLGEGIMALEGGALIQLDGGAGIVEVFPDDAPTDSSAGPARLPSPGTSSTGPAFTRDGRYVGVLANVSTLGDVDLAVRLGAEGAGLVRTELFFLDRANAPSESDQAVAYAAILEAFGGKPVTIRTWDVAPDKAMGAGAVSGTHPGHRAARGIRDSLRQPTVFMAQLRALFRARAMVGEACGSALSILFPHVTTVEELRAARGMLDRARDELAATGALMPPLSAGVMIEVPGAALMADAMAREAGFFSVGSNDLAQHLMAADRDDREAMSLLSGFQPAMLRLLHRVVVAGHLAGLMVTLCGELAASEASLPLTIGLAFDSLSVVPKSLQATRLAISRISFLQASRLVERALLCATAAEVRDLVNQAGW